jgi:hypothetical protein
MEGAQDDYDEADGAEDAEGAEKEDGLVVESEDAVRGEKEGPEEADVCWAAKEML